MLSEILIMSAAVLNAAMDSIENERFHSSIFSYYKQSFWYKRESWKHSKKVVGYRFDAWHIMKSLMIILVCLACVFFKQEMPLFLHVCVFGALWNLVFNLFYNHLFVK